jgi:hypothetical protein
VAKLARFPDDRCIEIRLSRCLLVLGERELLRLLHRDVPLWLEAVRRGKAIMRARRAGR